MKKIKIKDGRQKNYFQVGNALIENEDLCAYEKIIYVVLCRYADNNNSNCRPSKKTIANKAGMTKRTADKYLKKLIEKGLVKKENREKDNGATTSNIYIIYTAKRNAGGADDAVGGCNKCTGGVQEMQGKKTYNKKTNSKKTYNTKPKGLEGASSGSDKKKASDKNKKLYKQQINKFKQTFSKNKKPRIPEANIQALFYSALLEQDINVILEYKDKGCRLDCAIFNEDGTLNSIVEVKSYKTRKKPKTKTKQIKKYKDRFKVPVFMLTRIEDIPIIKLRVLESLEEKSNKSKETTEKTNKKKSNSIKTIKKSKEDNKKGSLTEIKEEYGDGDINRLLEALEEELGQFGKIYDVSKQERKTKERQRAYNWLTAKKIKEKILDKFDMIDSIDNRIKIARRLIRESHSRKYIKKANNMQELYYNWAKIFNQVIDSGTKKKDEKKMVTDLSAYDL